MKRASVKRFVFISTGLVYGGNGGGLALIILFVNFYFFTQTWVISPNTNLR